MIVAELINNAARHAFGDRGGKIQVAMTDRGCSMELTVADNGSGLGSFSEGQGTKIVRHLAGVLKATVDYRSTPSGTIARLSVPLVGDHTEPKAIAVGPNNGWRIFQDGDLENQTTKSFATTAPSLGGRPSATPQKEQT